MGQNDKILFLLKFTIRAMDINPYRGKLKPQHKCHSRQAFEFTHIFRRRMEIETAITFQIKKHQYN